MIDIPLIKVLLIEDNPGDARLLQELLVEVRSARFELIQVERLSQGLQQLQAQSFDVILLDLSLPDAQGLETFIQLHQRDRNTPIVVITGLNDETLASHAVQSGAQDYLVKDQVTGDVLVRSIRYAIERKRAEQKIREQAALLDIATDAILVQDLDGRILFWNKGAERLYGWCAAEIVGRPYESLSPNSEFAPEAAQSILFEQGEWSGELQRTTKSGKTVTVESRWSLVRGDDDQPKSILVVSTDVTEKKKLEAQFLRVQRMESIGTLASGLAHDLNNILTPILATAQLLQFKFPHLDERNQRLLKMLETNAKRGAALVKQVLLFARGVEGEQAVLQLEPLILETQQIAQETFPKSITIETKIAGSLWSIGGNATQLHQVLMNLCVNARDAMPDGGTLTISAENQLVDQAYAQANLDARVGSFVKLTVADTGTGIPPEVVDRIFEPFFTTKEIGKGTGLGLSTVLGIIQGHGGFVSVNSKVGQGTQFDLFLPAVMAMNVQEPQAAEILSGHEELVLIVDDEAAIRESSKALLEAYHYQVLTAANGSEAIALYHQHQKDIQVVLVDMMMPVMDGATTIDRLYEINSQVKVIAISGIVSRSQTAATKEADRFLQKPYTAEELLSTMRQVCGAIA
ncbi:response regulator [Leptolyngbya sp. FACHB-17]|uniref:hybrid sensor histidine kinase/response regulator n=1 Tax=unclassified Leptolyngbya TaxID=2650499 RepID=UPI0016803DD0|nr:response regulator [Leptolyngbya sp. FACHB-17]MBD2083014.1 response regulator [Leptolyngbya sp. FACHB-17]